MKVHVRVFASLREALGRDAVAVELPDQATVGDALKQLAKDHPELGDQPELVTALNREVVGEDEELRDGDEVAVFPPVSGGSIRDDPASLDELVEAVRTDGTGAVATFTGVVRGQSRGREVERLDYEAYEEMAEASLLDLRDRALERFDIEDARVVHRKGSFSVGEPVVYVAVAAAHREAAFAACRWLIDTLKEETPIWKKEHTADGSYWVEDHA